MLGSLGMHPVSDRKFYDAFCSESRKKLFRAVMHAGANPDKLKSRIRMLPHHARDEHKWKDRKCDFHELWLRSREAILEMVKGGLLYPS